MNETRLHSLAVAHTSELPAAVREYPFGPDTEVYKVCSKIFMLLGNASGTSLVTLKSRPSDATALRNAFSNITPGYHMNKTHWISVAPGKIPEDLFIDLITESYLQVVTSLPKRLRPVNPDTFGQRAALR